MKIIKKMVLITPLMLSISTISPISCANTTNLTKLTKSSIFHEIPPYLPDISPEDLSNPIVIQEEVVYITRIEVTNEQELNGLVIGNKTKMQIDVCPSSASTKKLEYESSNPEIATVEDGYIVPKSKGRTKIEICAKNSFPVHKVRTSFYVNVFDKGCKISFADDRNGRVTKSFVNVEVGSTFDDIIKNYDIPCIPNEGYQFDNWVDQNNNVINLDTPITSDTTIKATFKRLVFETDSWENIIKYAVFGLDKLKQIYNVDTFVGLERKVLINNQIHTVKVIDENHDTCTETGKKAALTFQLTTVLSDADGHAIFTQWDTGNCYNYTHGYLKGNLTGNGGKQSWDKTAWDMLPAELKSGIKKVNKTVWEWNSEGEDGHFVDYSDYLFALTCTELGQVDINEEYHTEGTPYKYWEPHKWQGFFTDRVFKEASGVVCRDYWLATPYTQQDCNEAWFVEYDGRIRHYHVETSYFSVSFGFCI